MKWSGTNPRFASTSIEAYQELKESGALGRMQMEAFELVVRHPHKTTNELQQLYESRYKTGLQRIQPRLSELITKGLIEKEDPRKCTVTGKTAYPLRLKEPDRSQMDLFQPA